MDGVRLYIKDVLGVESWIRPQVEAEAVAEAPALPRLGILRDASWTEGESAMVDKILSATGLDAVPAAQAQNLLVFGEGPVAHSGNVWNLGPLAHLMNGPPGQIQVAKREVWNLLKRLKEEIS